jgi:SAM-dependent methyltransferase
MSSMVGAYRSLGMGRYGMPDGVVSRRCSLVELIPLADNGNRGEEEAMATRARSRVAVGFVAATTAAALAVVLARAVDLKKLVKAQVAVPHGPLGVLSARMMPIAHQLFYRPAVDRLRLRPDDAFLEVACGSGVLLADHAAHVARVAGLDLSDVQVRLARQRLRDRIEAGTAEIVSGDAVALPWGDGTFTAVACVGSLEYLADKPAALQEMHRVLLPGGRMVLTYGLNDERVDIVSQIASWGLPTPSETEARSLVEEAGFVVSAVTYLEGDYPARYVEAIKPA